MAALLVVDLPGLDETLLQHMPRLQAAAGSQGTVRTVAPALTLPVHATLMTGSPAADHGLVANGWFERERNDVFFWPQSEKLCQLPMLWQKRGLKAIKYFCWPGMASSAQLFANVRPVYFSNGRKKGDVYCNEPDLSERIQNKFGTFPFHRFWGPGVNLESSHWIARSAAWLLEQRCCDLAYVYVPHLDYSPQIHGPSSGKAIEAAQELDGVVCELLSSARDGGMDWAVVSGYQMNAVTQPLYVNRMLREAGLLRVLCNQAGELIDYAASTAFAVVDHQIAHVYARDVQAAASALAVPGVAQVLDEAAQKELGYWHRRNGDLLLLAEPSCWFAYPYWLQKETMPDFAQTVAIHAKPGYDPCEMLLDENLALPKLTLARKLVAQRLGFRTILDVISLDASRIRGSHGVPGLPGSALPVWLASASGFAPQVCDLFDFAKHIERHFDT